jgi:hypothetical protein
VVQGSAVTTAATKILHPVHGNELCAPSQVSSACWSPGQSEASGRVSQRGHGGQLSGPGLGKESVTGVSGTKEVNSWDRIL